MLSVLLIQQRMREVAGGEFSQAMWFTDAERRTQPTHSGTRRGRHSGSDMPHALSIGTENSSLREKQVGVSLSTYPKGLLRKIICPA